MAPLKYFPVFARVRIQAPHVFAKKLIPQETFSCMYWFCAGGYLSGVALANLRETSVVRGLLGTDPPPDLTLESASPSPPQGSIWHRFNIDSTSIQHRFPDLTLFRCQINPEEGTASWIRGRGLGGLCLINPSQNLPNFVSQKGSNFEHLTYASLPISPL